MQQPSHSLPGYRRILLIDDDTDFRNITRIGLERHGFKVDTGESCADAMVTIERENYSLIVSDYRLPDGNGIDNYRFTRRIYPHMPFILISGEAHFSLTDPMFRSFLKPFQIQALVWNIRLLLEAAALNTSSVSVRNWRTQLGISGTKE